MYHNEKRLYKYVHIAHEHMMYTCTDKKGRDKQNTYTSGYYSAAQQGEFTYMWYKHIHVIKFWDCQFKRVVVRETTLDHPRHVRVSSDSKVNIGQVMAALDMHLSR